MTIVERKKRGQSEIFELIDPVTNRKSIWIPPKGLQRDEWLKALWYVTQRFEASTPQMEQHSMLSLVDVPPNITLCQFCAEVFMPRKTITLAENTRSSWQTCINLRIVPALGDYEVAKITDLQITDFLLAVQAEGLSKATVDKYYTVLQSIFKMACDVLKISDPMNCVKKPQSRKCELISSTPDAHTAEELAAIEKCLTREPLKWQAYFRLICDTGLRRGEACAIKWENIDFYAMTIKITASLGYTASNGVYETTPKNRRSRLVHIGNDAAYLLFQLYQESVNSNIDSPYVFHKNNSADPMNPTSPGWWFSKFIKRYGLPPSHPHKLRHSYASIAITNGADIASVSANLGHGKPDVTLRIYTTANEASKRQASDIARTAVNNAMPTIAASIPY